MQSGLLNSLIFLPLIAAIIILLLPKVYKVSYKWVSLVALILVLINTVTIWTTFDKNIGTYQSLEHYEWIRLALGKNAILSIDYILGLDGISLPLIMLTAIVFLIANISSFTINRKEKAFYALFLLLLSSVMGCFLALDLFLFFLFFEFMLLPMYFLIGIWGGPNKAYASLKFIIYTLVGSIFILVVMISLAMSYNDVFFSNEYKKIVYSFDFRLLSDTANLLKNSLLSIENPVSIFGLNARSLMFGLLLLGFGIKLPMVPFHTWLPDAHVEAPTSISIVLAGVLLKIGGYGLIRIAFGFFPDVAPHFSIAIAIFGLVSIIYGGLNALAQTDLKKLIAYSSISHMGFVLLGISANNVEGFSGAIFQMFSHGILSAMLFLVAGVLYDRSKNREISNFKGLAKQMPLFTLMVAIAFFASLGLPSLSGFIGEFFTIFAAFNAPLIPKGIAMASVLGIVLAAIYLLWTFQKMFLGQYWVNPAFKEKIVDISRREILMLGSLGVLAFVFGIFPNILFDVLNSTVLNLFTAK